ncbi:MAG: RsmD family RNA methyltransferase, partial [Chloroflexi bacterium]|nr:RsmD family RNA methyltransferase [Chloroflexota bacterium]
FGRIHCGRVGQFLQQAAAHVAKGEAQAFDLVLIDAPYAEPGLEEMLEALGAAGLIREGGRLIVEHSCKRSMPAEIASLSLVKAKRHGDTAISVYSRHPSQGVGGSSAR